MILRQEEQIKEINERLVLNFSYKEEYNNHSKKVRNTSSSKGNNSNYGKEYKIK